MTSAYTIGARGEPPNLAIVDRNLSRLLKEYKGAAMTWTKPTLKIYKLEIEKQNGAVASFKGKMIGTYYFDRTTSKLIYKSGRKTYRVSEEGRLSEIGRT